MPSCDKFFDQLAQCLKESKCVTELGNKPSKCLQLLIESKIDTEVVVPGAPRECMQQHQSYSECKVAMMNPRSRLRGPYGG